MSYSEKIKYDGKEFYVSRTRPDSEKEERLPLSTWHLEKTVTVTAIVRREIPSLDLNLKVRTIYYSVPIKYTVSPEAPFLYLRIEHQVNPDDMLNRKLAKVFLRDLETNTTQEAPLPNSLFIPKERFEIKIEKLKPHRLKHDKADEIVKSGFCLGLFDEDLMSRITYRSIDRSHAPEVPETSYTKGETDAPSDEEESE